MKPITSLLDNDLYNFTVSQALWREGHHEPTKFEFKNRSLGIPLADIISIGELQDHVQAQRSLWLKKDEAVYLASKGFDADWLKAFSQYRLGEVAIYQRSNWLHIEYEAPWCFSLFWETPLLSMVKALYVERMMPRFYAEAKSRLQRKLDILLERKRQPLMLVEGGTRRRASADWQYEALSRLLHSAGPMVMGTSNVKLAREFDVEPMGTIMHSLMMCMQALKQCSFSDTYAWVYELWHKAWPLKPMTLLTDTFTTHHFFSCVPEALIRQAVSVRQDSGNPFDMGKLIIKGIEHRGYSADDKRIMFGDSNDLNQMLALQHAFGPSASYLWGTDFTCDIGLDAPQIVIKPTNIAGNKCIKLGDDLAKANGDSATIAQALKQIQKETVEANHQGTA